MKLNLRHFAKILAAEAAQAGETGHNATTGKLRELVLHKFLKPRLPKRIQIRSGIIVDPTEKRSKQQDCILVDGEFPLIDVGNDVEAIVVAESVLATIEIKSFLDTARLEEALESIAITKRLERSGSQEYDKKGLKIVLPKPLNILSYVFAFDGLELHTLGNVVKQFAEKHQDSSVCPEAICVLSRGNIQRDSERPVLRGTKVMLPPIKEPKVKFEQDGEDTLFKFFYRLLDDVQPLRIVKYDLDRYFHDEVLE